MQTVAHHLHRSIITLTVGMSVSKAIAHIREKAPRGDIFYLYVVSETHELMGTLSIRNLLGSNDNELIENIFSKNVVSLSSITSIEDAYTLFSKSRFLSLPVIDEKNKLLGVVHAHELTDEYQHKRDSLFEERSRGDLFDLLGIHATTSRKKPISKAIQRFPWLLINILGGIFSAMFIQKFGIKIPNAIETLAFVPVILIISESIGMQTASMVIHRLRWQSSKKALLLTATHEWWVSFFLGLFCAIFTACYLFLWKQNLELSYLLGLGIFLGSAFVATVGIVIPRLFHYFKIDPKIASGPVVLSIADCGTLLIFLLLACLISR